MRTVKKDRVPFALLILLVAGFFALAVACKGSPGPGGPKGEPGPAGPAAKLTIYTVSTAETPIPNTPSSEGNLQQDVLCKAGDFAIGGGHIIHPSSTTDILVTKSYATNAAGDFAPSKADRWRGKVLNPRNLTDKRFTVHVVCMNVAP